jgi:hypothetical protein
MSVASSGPELVRINATGQAVISGLTILGAGYLLIALVRQGTGKLRGRLLLGMIFGDIALG